MNTENSSEKLGISLKFYESKDSFVSAINKIYGKEFLYCFSLLLSQSQSFTYCPPVLTTSLEEE